MMYLIPRSYDGLDRDKFGILDRPHSDKPTRMIKQGYKWAGDNEAFTGKFSLEAKPNNRANKFGFYDWVEMMQPYRDTCLFIAIPDVIADAKATLEQFEKYAPRIRELGFPVAYVGQDGAENLPFPEQFDALFLGGSTEWKLSQGAAQLIRRAQALGKWIHIGRINSGKRYKAFQLLGCDSCDGTHICFSPDSAVKRMNSWVNQQPLFTMKG